MESLIRVLSYTSITYISIIVLVAYYAKDKAEVSNYRLIGGSEQLNKYSMARNAHHHIGAKKSTDTELVVFLEHIKGREFETLYSFFEDGVLYMAQLENKSHSLEDLNKFLEKATNHQRLAFWERLFSYLEKESKNLNSRALIPVYKGMTAFIQHHEIEALDNALRQFSMTELQKVQHELKIKAKKFLRDRLLGNHDSFNEVEFVKFLEKTENVQHVAFKTVHYFLKKIYNSLAAEWENASKDPKFKVKMSLHSKVLRLIFQDMIEAFALKEPHSFLDDSFLLHNLATIADYAQYTLEQAGYPVPGQLIGAAGNIIAGIISGGWYGGFIGFGIWLSGEFASDNELSYEEISSYMDDYVDTGTATISRM